MNTVGAPKQTDEESKDEEPSSVFGKKRTSTEAKLKTPQKTGAKKRQKQHVTLPIEAYPLNNVHLSSI